MDPRDIYIQALKDRLGKPYRYGAQGPDAFDCSGLVLDCLLQAGLKLPDMTAQNLYEYFHQNKVLLSASKPGCLVFYWSKTRNYICHVMSVYQIWPNGERMLAGACSGDSDCITIDIAVLQNASVKLALASNYQPSMLALVVDPFRESN
jgi:hypothetical protein